MTKKLLGLILLAFLFSNCANLKTIDKVNSYNAEFTDINSSNKKIRFVGMTDLGQPQFYDNSKKIIEEAKNNGYVIFYENISIENMSDSSLRKLRKMLGYIPSLEIKQKQYKAFINKGYVLRDDRLLFGLNSDSSFIGDISGDELIAEYERKFGRIKLTNKDISLPLTTSLPLIMLLPKANKVTIDFRNQKIAKLLAESKYEKIVALYDFKQLNGLANELHKIDGSYLKSNTITTENNPAYLQVVSGDSIRKSTTDYIIEDGHIDQINQYMNVRLSLKNYYEFFSLNSNNNKYDIRTNSGTTLKLAADYKSISIWYTFTPKDLGLNTEEVEKGTTGGFNFGFSVIRKNWFNQFNFRYINGFYLENTKDYIPTWKTGDVYIQKPKLGYAALEGTTGYKFNSKYSLRSVNSQTERQLKSTGSLILSANYRFYQLKDESSPLFDSILRSDNYELGFNLGYFYNIVVKKNLYISLGASPGLGIIYSKVDQKNSSTLIQQSNHNSGVFRLSGHVGIGYNGERFYTGLYADFSAGGFLKENIPVVNTDFRNLYQAFVGYRFEVSKSIRANRMY